MSFDVGSFAKPRGAKQEPYGQHDARPEAARGHGGSEDLHAIKDGVKANPDLKGKSKPSNKGGESSAATKHAKHTKLGKSELEKAEDKLEKHDVVPSVFGSDRTTISAEAQLVPSVTRKADAVGAKKLRGKYNLPGLSGLLAKGTPKPNAQEHFDGFLQALVQNFS